MPGIITGSPVGTRIVAELPGPGGALCPPGYTSLRVERYRSDGSAYHTRVCKRTAEPSGAVPAVLTLDSPSPRLSPPGARLTPGLLDILRRPRLPTFDIIGGGSVADLPPHVASADGSAELPPDTVSDSSPPASGLTSLWEQHRGVITVAALAIAAYAGYRAWKGSKKTANRRRRNIVGPDWRKPRNRQRNRRNRRRGSRS